MIADHLGRTEKDFAIEFGEYMAHDAERFLASPDNAALSLCQRAVDDLARYGYVTGSTVERMKKLLAAPAESG